VAVALADAAGGLRDGAAVLHGGEQREQAGRVERVGGVGRVAADLPVRGDADA
jgi:hypothetical protein